MSNLSGDKSQEFLDWLEEAMFLLPPKMMISEARELFERKLREEEEIKNETRKKSSQFE